MSWHQLKAIIDENRQEARSERSQPPVACPIDGALLDVDKNGVRNCPLGNFRWNGGPVVIGSE